MSIHTNKRRDTNFAQYNLAIIKEGLLAIFIVFIMLLPGVILDNIFWGNITFGTNIISNTISSTSLRTKSIFGISYNNAYKILNSNVGVLVTLVSMFLTMNISIAERSEKKVYGIPRKDLYASNNGHFYRWTRRISYIAPALMILFLNLSYCISGYLLFAYCNVFLLMHYCIHESSFSKDRIQAEIVNKLVKCFSNTDVSSEDKVVEYRSLLECIGKSVEEDDNWLDIGVLYKQLIIRSDNFEVMRRYQISYHFFHTIYWGNNRECGKVALEAVKSYLTKIDSDMVTPDYKLLSDLPVLWGMLKASILNSKERELADFLMWFLSFHERSRVINQETKNKLPANILDEESSLIIILMEYRLRIKGLKSEPLNRLIKGIWNHGKIIFIDDEKEIIKCIQLLSEKAINDALAIQRVLESLESDYLYNTRKTIITNI